MFKKKNDTPENFPMVDEMPPIADTSAENSQLEAQLAELRVQNAKQKSPHAPAGPEARPGRFASRRPGSILSIDGSRISDPEEIARKKALIELYHSYNNKHVLSGRVEGVLERYDRSSGQMKYVVLSSYGPYQVYIPLDDFSDVNMAEMTNALRRKDPNLTVEKASKVYLQHRMNAEIDFVIKTPPEAMADEGELIVGGDRLEAIRRTRIRYWYGIDSYTGKYVINEGDVVEARIVSASVSGIRVEVFGVECFIASPELAYTLIQDCSKVNELQPGNRTLVRITSIVRDKEDNYKVEFHASRRQTMKDPRDAGMRKYHEGGVFIGTINFIRIPADDAPYRRPGVFVLLEKGVQCLCPFPNGSVPPQLGAKVYVRITNLDYEKKHIYAKITHIIPGEDDF